MMNWHHLRHYDMLYTCALSLAFSKLEVDCSLQTQPKLIPPPQICMEPLLYLKHGATCQKYKRHAKNIALLEFPVRSQRKTK